MKDNVVGIREQIAVPNPNAPVANVVALLEELLAEARNGNMRAVACAWVIDDGTPHPLTFESFEVEFGRGRYLESATMSLLRSIGRWMDH